MVQLCGRFRPCLGLVLSLCFLPVFGQSLAPRLSGPISESARSTLAHSASPRVRTAQDLGAVPREMLVPGITLVFRRSSAQEAALKDLLAAQQDRNSALYHHWLTPETFAARFGVADEDIATTESWLSAHGFRVENVSRSRDRITFSGSAGQVQTAFGAELHRYRVEGGLHFAPASDLALPSALASVTAAVIHISDFRPRPGWRVPTKEKPAYTVGTTGAHYLVPRDIAVMYNINPIYQRGFLGDGQAIVVVGQSYVNTGYPGSVSLFQAIFAGPGPSQTFLVPGSGVEAISPGDEGESEIDLEYSSGIAPNSNIFLVYVGSSQNYSVFDSLAFAITDDLAPVISISYGTCEPLLSQTDLEQNNAVYEEAAAQGQTLVASAGDSGSTACAPYTTADGATLAEQQELAVNFPASSPYVTAVGGTQMAEGTFDPLNSTYWALPAGNTDLLTSLLTYVPEVTWNEGSFKNGIIAGGGGQSSYFPRPSWQSALAGMPAGTNRLLPDIALQSSIANPGFIICTDDPTVLSSEGQTSSCSNGVLGSGGKLTTAGGTSFAAPVFAGYVALLNEAENATGQGNMNLSLYSLAGNAKSYSATFHDIASGSNACESGEGSCVLADESSYVSTPGYDEATGLGSVDFNALTETWPAPSNSALQSTLLFIVPAAYAATAGQTVPLLINAGTMFGSSSSTLPTGGVSVSVDGTVADASLAFTGTGADSTEATVTYNLVAPAAPGSHAVTVTYPGDASHSPAKATFAVLVGNVVAGGGISLNAANVTIANGSTGSTKVTVTPTGGYDGRLTWSLAASSTTNKSLTACYTIASLPVDNITSTNLTIGIGSACGEASPSYREDFKRLSRSAVTVAHGQPQSIPARVVYASFLLFGCLMIRRRRGPVTLLLWILLLPVAGVNLTGCGGGGSNSTSTPPVTTPTSPSNYTLTLTGTDSLNVLVTATTTFTLTTD